MGNLQDESIIQTAEETLDDWERVLTGSVTAGLTAAHRRTLLLAAKAGNITMSGIKEIGQLYGVSVTGVQFPFRSAFFGFSRFGVDRVAGPAAFSVLFVYAAAADESAREPFENQLSQRLPANYIVYFIYGGA
jgi:hypothetical protein